MPKPMPWRQNHFVYTVICWFVVNLAVNEFYISTDNFPHIVVVIGYLYQLVLLGLAYVLTPRKWKLGKFLLVLFILSILFGDLFKALFQIDNAFALIVEYLVYAVSALSFYVAKPAKQSEMTTGLVGFDAGGGFFKQVIGLFTPNVNSFRVVVGGQQYGFDDNFRQLKAAKGGIFIELPVDKDLLAAHLKHKTRCSLKANCVNTIGRLVSIKAQTPATLFWKALVKSRRKQAHAV